MEGEWRRTQRNGGAHKGTDTTQLEGNEEANLRVCCQSYAAVTEEGGRERENERERARARERETW